MKNSRVNILAGAAPVVYRNSFGVPFVFDDEPSIRENPSITHLWPLSGPLSPPPGFGYTVSGRPLLNLSLAVNYAISGTEVWSDHALNLLIHVLAGLTLLGLVRRSLLLLPQDAICATSRRHTPVPQCGTTPLHRGEPSKCRPI